MISKTVSRISSNYTSASIRARTCSLDLLYKIRLPVGVCLARKAEVFLASGTGPSRCRTSMAEVTLEGTVEWKVVDRYKCQSSLTGVIDVIASPINR